MKAVGARSAVIRADIQLYHAIGGKTRYRFQFKTRTGTAETPKANLVDGVKKKDFHATVFREGETPKKWENWIELNIGNLSEMDKSNLSVTWKENGK